MVYHETVSQSYPRVCLLKPIFPITLWVETDAVHALRGFRGLEFFAHGLVRRSGIRLALTSSTQFPCAQGLKSRRSTRLSGVQTSRGAGMLLGCDRQRSKGWLSLSPICRGLAFLSALKRRSGDGTVLSWQRSHLNVDVLCPS